jgi:hypothetical protein
MSTVLQPWATSGDVIGCALALGLDEDREVGGCTIPDLEGLEKLETVALGVNSDVDAGTVCRGRLEGVLARVIATRWQFITGRSLELEGLPSAPMRESAKGLKLSFPANAKAVVMSGDATKAWVAGLASLRLVKLRL